MSKKKTAAPEQAKKKNTGAEELPVNGDQETGEREQDKEDGGEAPAALQELFLSSIKDIYWAENHLVATLPKMILAATSESLKTAIGAHLEETKTHVERLEQVFGILYEKPKAKKCDAMEGITMEGEEIIEETKKGTPARDVGIILASQKVEHYEIATYSGLIKLAMKIEENDIADILAQTLEEERSADEKLSAIAESEINYGAPVE